MGAAATIASTGVDATPTFELQEQARDATTVCEMCTGNGNDEFCISMFDGPHGCYYIEGFCNEQEICDQAAADQSIAVATPKRSWSLPIKLNTNAIYHTNQDTIVATPRGNQQAKMRPSPTRGDVTIVKRGPAEGERVLERYRAVDEGHIEQELTHVPASGERVVVRRTFMRAA